MKIATGEIEERVEKPPLEEDGRADRVFARARGGMTRAAREANVEVPPHPLYGPGLPPPGAKAEPGP